MRDTIEMAREAGIEFQTNTGLTGRTRTTTMGSQSIESIERLIELARADEREACANLLDSTDLSAMSADPKLQNWTAALLFQYAAAIRARGETK
jgi:hypothetical protein